MTTRANLISYTYRPVGTIYQLDTGRELNAYAVLPLALTDVPTFVSRSSQSYYLLKNKQLITKHLGIKVNNLTWFLSIVLNFFVYIAKLSILLPNVAMIL